MTTDRATAIVIETGPSMELGAPSKRSRATREALRLFGGAGAWTPCEGRVRWVSSGGLAAALEAARHLDLPELSRQIARLPVERVVVFGDLYDPRAILDAMRPLGERERIFVEVLSPAERGARAVGPMERALVAYLQTLRPHRERAREWLRATGVHLEDLPLAA